MGRGIHVVLAVAVVTVGLAGCIGIGDSGTDAAPDQQDAGNASEAFVPAAPDYDFQDAIDVNHPDHQNPQSHTEGHGFSEAGYTDFSELYAPDQQVGWTEVDVEGHLAAIASYKGFNGITLVDIEDPSDPQPLSLIPSAGDDYDARFSDDGRYLFFGCQSGDTAPAEGRAGDCRSTEPSQESSETSGVVAYDISDPEDPTYVGIQPGVATHNIWTHTVDGDVYVFTDGVEILRFTPDAEAAFEQVASVPGSHDAYVHEHPVTGDTLLYTGAGNTFAVYNVTDPSDPRVLVEQGPEVTGWHKQVASDELIDGRALLVVGGEVFTDEAGTLDGSDPPMLTVLDVTDPAEPEVLSDWTLPVSDLPPWVNYRWSPHNVDISPHGQVSVAWNHGGIWVFDVSTQERQEDPVTLAFHQPHRTPPLQPPTVNPTGDVAVPRVWGGMFDHHGYLVVADMYTGLYVLEPDWGLYAP